MRHVDDGLQAPLIEHGVRQRDREQLIRPDRIIVTLLAVHYVEQGAGTVVPEPRVERFANVIRETTVALLSVRIPKFRAGPLLHQT